MAALSQASVKARHGPHRRLHGTLAVTCAAALGLTVAGISTHFTTARYDHVPTSQELVEFRSGIDLGRPGCLLRISPDRRLESGAPWVKGQP